MGGTLSAVRAGLSLFEVVARNLPEHARNPIHTDVGARGAGFPAALVAGVTTYAYLSHVPLAAWGIEWLATGGGELHLRSPVFVGDAVTCRPVGDDEVGWTVMAHVGDTVDDTGSPRGPSPSTLPPTRQSIDPSRRCVPASR